MTIPATDRPQVTTSDGPVALGIDIGTTNIKVAAVSFDDDGPRVLGERRLATAATPDDLVATVRGALRDLIGSTPAAADASAIGIASMAETGAFFDAGGQALTPLVFWHDRRAEPLLDDLREQLDEAAVFARTGVRLSHKPSLVKWIWFARQRALSLGPAVRWAGAAESIGWWLTGELTTDPSLAGRTMAYDLHRNRYDEELLSLTALDERNLPVVAGPDHAAALTAEVAADLGLRAGLSVYIAGHDHAVGAWAVGVRSPGQAADSIGTSEATYLVAPEPSEPAVMMARASSAGVSVVRTIDGAHLALIAGLPAAGALVDWWSRTLAPGRTPADLFDDLPEATAPDAAAGPLVLPYLAGRQSPRPDPGARLVLADVGPADDADALRAGLLDGLVLALRWMLDTQAEIAGCSLTDLVVLGGPTRNRPWMKRKAAASPCAVRIGAWPDTVAAGAALVAAVRGGFAPASTTLPVEDIQASAMSHERYARFLDLLG